MVPDPAFAMNIVVLTRKGNLYFILNALRLFEEVLEWVFVRFISLFYDKRALERTVTVIGRETEANE